MTTLTNGHFDLPLPNGSINGWTASPAATVTLHSNVTTPITPQSTPAYVELNGVSSVKQSSISQTANVIIGQSYTLSFYIFYIQFSTFPITYTLNFLGNITDTNILDNSKYTGNWIHVTAGPVTAVSDTFSISSFGGPLYVDTFDIIGPVPCFSGKSIVRCRNKQTNEIADINASNVFSDIHEVYSVNTDKFVPIIYNAKAGLTTDYYLIKKDTIAENQPSDDFYITYGHPIVIDGQEIVAANLPQAKKVIVEPDMVYTICTEIREPILINGLAVLTWNEADWLAYVADNSLVWKNN